MCNNNDIVTTIKKLVEQLLKNAGEIVIEGDLVKKIVKIKVTGVAAWIIACGSISVAAIAASSAIAAIAAPPAEAGIMALAASSAVPAVSILGMSTASAAVSIALAGGGVEVLNKLREYEIVEKYDSRLVLRRK